MGGRPRTWSSSEDHQLNSGRALQAARVATDGGDQTRTTLDALEPCRSASELRRRVLLADVVAVLLGFAFAFVVQAIVRPVHSSIVARHLLLMVASLPGFAFGAATARLHRARNNERPRDEVFNILRTVAVGVAMLVTLAFGLQFKHLSRLWIGLVGVGTASMLILDRRIARRVFARLRRTGRLTRRIVIVGTDAHAVRLLHTYQRNPSLGYEVIGFVGETDIGERGGVGVLGPLDSLARVLEHHDANGVVISLCSVGDDTVNQMTRRLTDAGYHVALSTSLTDIDVTRLLPQQVDGRTMLYIEPVIRHGWRARAKRAFDVVVAASMLVLSAPVLLAAMLAIKIDSGGTVLYRQERVGRDGRRFTLTKLRTMVADADARLEELADLNEADGPLFKIEDDPRITRIGRFLRRSSIDELPQLLSVLRGDMSMVGPRPALPHEVEQWDEGLIDRLRVLPGVTGMWQVSGRSDTSFEQYRRLDLYYVDNWSLTHDLRICAKTIGVVLSGKGAA